jgi:hypothetical protein
MGFINGLAPNRDPLNAATSRPPACSPLQSPSPLVEATMLQAANDARRNGSAEMSGMGENRKRSKSSGMPSSLAVLVE